MSEKIECLLTQKQAAAYFGCTTCLLRKWRRLGKGPTFVKISRKFIRYRIEDLDAFLADHVVIPGAQEK